MTNQTNTNWSIKGKKFNPNDPDNPTPGMDLTIPETNPCIVMPDHSGAFGTPIDADLAVRFIYNFYMKFSTIFHPSHAEDFKESLDKLSTDELKDIALKAKEFHQDVVNLNYGMTLDKNIASKILSQPGCEGLRFYLCAKADENVSLVVLGVDCEGFDLNYKTGSNTIYSENDNNDGVLPQKPGARTLQSVAMNSLIGEYVTPPYTILLEDMPLLNSNAELKTADTENDGLDRFVLLNIATQPIKI
ncbi:hypothetical protein [Mucilaginibacter sp.]|uniref:hypothetical protein n=1 Tax=Mucilaginibacter sp. TaxID=1882438 RepID=UPI003D1507DF